MGVDDATVKALRLPNKLKVSLTTPLISEGFSKIDETGGENLNSKAPEFASVVDATPLN